MAETSPNLQKYMKTNIQEAQQAPSRLNSKRPILRQNITKLLKAKDIQNLGSSTKKQLIRYKGSSI